MATKSTKRPPTPESPTQLRLVADQPDAEHPEMESVPWRLDDETKAIGRKGIAQARQILRAARPTHLDPAA